ncbi:MAG TPA: hypothetical protein VGC03_08220 [Acidimicrobiia bacterium]
MNSEPIVPVPPPPPERNRVLRGCLIALAIIGGLVILVGGICVFLVINSGL